MKHNHELTLCRLGTILSLAALAMMLLMLTSCSPRTVYIPVENTAVRTDTLYRTSLRVDSVMLRDSVTLIRRDDTVYLTKYRDRLRYRERIDTLYQSVTDSVEVRVPYPVERELTKWERSKMELGGWAFGALAVAVIAVVWLVFKKRQK